MVLGPPLRSQDRDSLPAGIERGDYLGQGPSPALRSLSLSLSIQVRDPGPAALKSLSHGSPRAEEESGDN